MNATIRRDALCRRYPRSARGLELGMLLSLCMSAYAVACLLLGLS